MIPKTHQYILEIEKTLDLRLIVYFLGDRPLATTQIADDAIRPMYEHLKEIGKCNRLGLFLYGVGGVMETPWKIVTMLREFCDELVVIVPYKAYSAATMICLGADKILMTPKGELSPIDPILQFIGPERPSQLLMPEIGVEDISSYVKFLKERAGLTDQSALSEGINALAQILTPPFLGRIERVYSHIRLVARKLLSLCRPPLDERKITTIVESLTEKTYAHGHGIGRKEAKEIGLPVEYLDEEKEKDVWELYKKYEEWLKLRSISDPRAYFTDTESDTYTEKEIPFACIESSKLLHTFIGDFQLQRIRKIPPQPVINVNLNVSLPPNILPAQIPQQVHLILQQLLQQASQQIQQMVAQEIARQSPVERIEGGIVGGDWKLVQRY
ncbi:MAG: hypothetical protein QXE05_00915 [Nitrososphaeria archaeon]